MTQEQAVLNYMEQNGSISCLEATNELCIYRLSAKIYKLKKDGYKIHTEMKKGNVKYEKPSYYAVYSLEA